MIDKKRKTLIEKSKTIIEQKTTVYTPKLYSVYNNATCKLSNKECTSQQACFRGCGT